MSAAPLHPTSIDSLAAAAAANGGGASVSVSHEPVEAAGFAHAARSPADHPGQPVGALSSAEGDPRKTQVNSFNHQTTASASFDPAAFTGTQQVSHSQSAQFPKGGSLTDKPGEKLPAGSPLASGSVAQRDPLTSTAPGSTSITIPPPAMVAPPRDRTRAEILAEEEAEKAKEKPSVPLKDVFKYADRTDKILMGVGAVAAFCNGAGMPAFSLIFGELVEKLKYPTTDLEHEISKTAAIMVYVGLGVLALSAIQVMTWMIACERQTARIRRSFFASVMRQEAAYHDEIQPGAITAQLAGDVLLLRNGFSDKTAGGILNFGQFVCGFAFGFWKSWRLTLVMCGTLPMIAAAGAWMNHVLTAMTTVSRKHYAKAGDISDEVLSNIRTVQMFGTEEREVKRYNAALEEATGAGIKKEFASSLGIGVTYFLMFGSYALAFWFASVLIDHGWNDIGDVSSTFFSVLIASFGLGLSFPAFAGLAEARGAAYKVYSVIDRKSKIDPNTRGKILENFRGEIEFRGMTFVYPTRPDTKLFTDLNLTVGAGTTVAFSGASGCGKSSVVGLVQRFYDPVGGQVLVDGVDLRELDLKWWRDQIGVVSQEPNLFSGTILQNVRLGKPDATLEQVQDACRQAAIHDTIMGLPEQYDTSVGAVGGQLSGGQKQRIAIARAIVRQPKLLILDEATSALDRKSEMEVQAALDALVSGSVRRTVLVIAHRLVTIQNADTIHYITNDALVGSKVAESGTYNNLIAKKGQFAAMASRQARSHAVQADAEAAGEQDLPGAGAAPTEALARANSSLPGSTLMPGSTTMATAVRKTLEEQVEDEVKNANASTYRVAKMSTDTLWAVLLGLAGSIMSGSVYPAYSIVFAQMLNVLGRDDKGKITLWSCMFLVLATGALIGWLLQGFHAFTGEKLTKKLRIMAFRNMLRQDQTFFDMPGRDPGGLQGILSGDCEAVHQMWGPSLGYKIQMACTLCGGLVIGFIYSWKLALLACCGVPIMIMAGVVQQMFITGFGENKGNESSVVTETLTNIRTVMSFNAQTARFRLYAVDLDKKEKAGVKSGVVAGIAFGITQFSFFGVFALALWYGGKLMAKGELTFLDVMTASTAVLMGAMGAGEAGGFLSKMAESAKASKRVFAVVDRVPTVDINKKGDVQIGDPEIKFENVRFIYPARESAVVLKHFNSRLPARGQYGLMGSTGCGKSTIIQLLARFYQPARGTVSVGGKDLQSLDLRTWRSQMSAVFQEPSLFSGTVRENIAYSRPEATDAEIEDAARLAGIHEDVMRMEAGYRTQVGYKGRMLSGGQKQRVAIARGLLRRPKLLLLDEATSALDNATEARVQEGILEAHRRHPMTIVSVAHRLTTIRHSDRIMLLDDGVLLEAGTHDELVALDGEYKKRWDLFQQDSSSH